MKFPLFDIFSAVQTLWIVAKEGGQLTRFVFASYSINMYTIENTLRQYGVLVYGRSLRTNGERTFLVKNAQAKWTHQLCLRAGFPVIAPSFPENSKYRDAGLPKRKWQKDGRKGDGFYALASLMKRFFSWLS